jgi:negative regulator of sigma E activity
MDCDFTQEVSLLVDGEMAPHEAARLRAHVEGCATCQQAREAFLLLRQELRSYERAPDPHAQSRALAAILDSRTSASEVASPSAGASGRRFPPPRETVRGLWGRLNEAPHVRRLRPAHVATLALLLIATALGLRWLAGSRTSPGTRQPGAPALADMNGQPARATSATEAGATRADGSDAVDSPTVYEAKTQKPTHPAGTKPNPVGARENAQVRRGVYRTGRERREGLSRDSRTDVARAGSYTSPPSSSNVVVAPDGAGGRLMAAAAPVLRIGRHAERVERLLRSFRNARLSESDPTLDAADARRLSKRLLYSNIALRREAADAGDLPVEGWLDSLEPILLDISNLPNNPSPDAVGSIKERIRRRQLVGVLQAQVMLASNP